MFAFDEERIAWNDGGIRVTDFKANSCFLFPIALHVAEERKLEVLRM